MFLLLSVVASESDVLGDDILGAIPFTLPGNQSNQNILQLFQASVNSVNEEENIIFTDLVQEAQSYRIKYKDEISEDFLPEEYDNLKLVIDKNGKIRVPNLFEVNDRPELPSLLERFLRKQQRTLDNLVTEKSPADQETEDLKQQYKDENIKPDYDDLKEKDDDYKKSESYHLYKDGNHEDSKIRIKVESEPKKKRIKPNLRWTHF